MRINRKNKALQLSSGSALKINRRIVRNINMIDIRLEVPI